jgi:hypothetical protein
MDNMESTEKIDRINEKPASGQKRTRKSKKAKAKSEPKLREVRKRAVAVMCPKVSGIAKALTKSAGEGNCQAAKLVFEFLGIFPPPTEEDDGDDTLARYLLRQLGIPDHPSEEEITKVLGEGKEANTDTVESS